jgi:sterol 14-demethylase
MSSATNGTTPILDTWSGYVAYAQAQLTPQNTRLALLSMVTIPVLAVVLNVLSQVVCGFSSI